MPRQIIPDISRYHGSSRQLLVPFDYQYTDFFSILWHIKRVAGYLYFAQEEVNLMLYT